jgi:hypothetical protein
MSDETKRDVGIQFENAHVLLSNDFYYFGRAGTTKYREDFPALAHMLARLTQGHRVNHDPHVRSDLKRLVKTLWKKSPPRKVTPSDADTSRRCN